MLNKDFSWYGSIESIIEMRADKADSVTGPYIFGGTAVVNSSQEIGKNGWGVPDDELANFSKTFPGAQLRADHGRSVYDIVGKVNDGLSNNGAVKFVAELGDKNLSDKVRNGYISHVSICATADKVTCNVCGKETRPKRTCACENSHELIRGLKLKELSLVAEPAFDSAKIAPMSFSAAFGETITEEVKEPVKAEKIQGDVINMSQENKVENKVETKALEPTAPIIAKADVKPAGSEDSKVILADKMEAVMKKMDEAATKYQMFWDEARKNEQAFWDKKKEDEAKKEECKKEEAWPKKDEDESKKEESRPGPTPITPIATPSVIVSKPPTIVKKFDEEEDESKKEEEKASAPALQAKTDTSEDTIPLQGNVVPTNPAELLAAALNDIKNAAKKAEMI